ncbi:hypothetical protein NHQ30_004899 [Ciborinia camelliae]|nr:hypothetical protein NHQ30_004899 [Ciborinia camelliae]
MLAAGRPQNASTTHKWLGILDSEMDQDERNWNIWDKSARIVVGEIKRKPDHFYTDWIRKERLKPGQNWPR